MHILRDEGCFQMGLYMGGIPLPTPGRPLYLCGDNVSLLVVTVKIARMSGERGILEKEKHSAFLHYDPNISSHPNTHSEKL